MTTGTHTHAEAAATERLVNAYLRETGAGHPDPAGSVAIPLPRNGSVLCGQRTLTSLTGHHRYAGSWQVDGRPVGPTEIAALLGPELGADAATARQFAAQVADSVAHAACYLDRGAAHVLDTNDPAIAGERALTTGHAFHPTPKTAVGFDECDRARYAPELGARFALAWVALRGDAATTWAEPGADRALRRLRGIAPTPPHQGWHMLPVHPWQAAWLERCPVAADLVREGVLRPLGPAGPAATPTSSVRTVLLADLDLFIKLPLDVRVTNFVRTNPPDQLARALDASRAIATVCPPASLRILPDLAACLPTGPAAPVAEHLGVLLRGAPHRDQGGPIVVAGLCEDAAGTREPPLAAAVRRAAAARGVAVTPGWVDRWLRAYLDVTVAPVAVWLLRTGVSLEAHVQNCLVRLNRGWPVMGYVRDLEGVSLDRTHPVARTFPLPADSPALYDPETAWQRFAYYVLVNHLGEVAATLARALPTTEQRCWTIARRVLDTVLAGHCAAPGAGRLDALLTHPELPAKANLTSLLAGHSEHPTYLPIPNPLAIRS